MNNGLQLPKHQIDAVRPEDLQQYLQGHGWVVSPEASSVDVAVLHHPAQPEAEVLLPRRREFGDYALRVADVIRTVAAVEQRAIGEVLRDVSGPPADVIRLRLAAPGATLGVLPLEEGIQLIQGGRDLLLAAACSAHQPQPHYPRQTFREALDFLADCRLGQTERGSYVATLLAPVPPVIEPQPSLFAAVENQEVELANEPYSRRVTVLLMTALNVIGHGIQTGNPQSVLAGVRQGVSANLCDALTRMKPSGDQSSLQVEMNWSPARARLPRTVPSKVRLAQGAFDIIEEIGRQLHERFIAANRHIEGHVVALQAETNLFEGFEGRVTLRCPLDDQLIRIRLILNRDDYAKACDAHRDGRRVAVTGILHRDGAMKMVELLQPRNFAILP